MMKKEQFPESSPLAKRYSPEPVAKRWLALVPFFFPPLMLGLMYLFYPLMVKSDHQEALLGSVLYLSIYLVFLAGYVIGWVRGFPRWWWSLPILIILFSLLLKDSMTPGISLLGISIENQIWGWQSWVPLGLATLLAIVFSFSSHPYHSFWQGLWQEPTRLAYSFYCGLPYFSIALFDETKGNFSLPFIIASFIVLMAGAWFYLKAANPIHRLLILLGVSLGMTLVNLTAIAIYWNGRLEPWMTTPNRWQDDVAGGLMGLAMLAILLVVPVAIFEFACMLVSLKINHSRLES